ncbi:dipeptide ABC transporter membrane subunit DppC [Hyphomicrobiales bacterium]|nr:dipeptide ABC transporter membrane subunit DppC [Hyphomicrobiales bacterium]CAH1698625.1 dipeptide ABC transporter membrane subunit DppC [Hyphomicrobiales bacterium]CAI0342271.1 dipeptide ABC transporter membrane subunit DppC [Hyphomicrobiales bacterium]
MNSPVLAFFRSLFRRKLVLVATVVLAVVFVLAVLAPWLAPYDPGAMRVARRLRPPSEVNWFGTDELGRDIFSRIVWGARASLGIGFSVVVISVALGTALGLLAGYYKRLDGPIMRFVDALMSLPDILLAIFLVAVLGASAGNVILALSIVYTPRVVRVIRASTLVVREMPFVESARSIGASTARILSVHLLPNIASPVLVQATFIFAYAVLAEAGLSFLGAGVPPETPTWGTMIASGQQYADDAFWLVAFPGLAIVFVALSLQILGDGLRDMLDPRLRKAL